MKDDIFLLIDDNKDNLYNIFKVYACKPKSLSSVVPVVVKKSPSIVINISGGNNQILPVATHPEQHYHYHTAGTVGAVSNCTNPDLPNDMQDHRLAIYINNVEDLRRYLSLLSLTPHIPSGTTVANYRKAIENAWYSRKD